jgi:hypothetical protein
VSSSILQVSSLFVRPMKVSCVRQVVVVSDPILHPAAHVCQWIIIPELLSNIVSNVVETVRSELHAIKKLAAIRSEWAVAPVSSVEAVQFRLVFSFLLGVTIALERLELPAIIGQPLVTALSLCAPWPRECLRSWGVLTSSTPRTIRPAFQPRSISSSSLSGVSRFEYLGFGCEFTWSGRF